MLRSLRFYCILIFVFLGRSFPSGVLAQGHKTTVRPGDTASCHEGIGNGLERKEPDEADPELKTGDYNTFIREHLHYPDSACKCGIKGIVIIRAEIDETGKLCRTLVMHSPGYGCTEEALRVAGMMQDWKPGLIDGRSVRCRSHRGSGSESNCRRPYWH